MSLSTILCRKDPVLGSSYFLQHRQLRCHHLSDFERILALSAHNSIYLEQGISLDVVIWLQQYV
jgi:hypothetical protein